jgi:hypothetical protein
MNHKQDGSSQKYSKYIAEVYGSFSMKRDIK